MVSIPDNVRQDLITFIPSSLIKETTCFVFYDNHPRNKKYVDIIVCTSRGEVKEFYKRDLVNSIVINSSWKPKDIQILRNTKCEIFYLVACDDEIAIVSSREELKVLHVINNVDTYEVDDFFNRGQGSLKVICKDDAVPLFFDNNFEKLADRTDVLSKDNTDDLLPIIVQLASKLTEAKYSVMCNEKVLKDLSSLRQAAAYSNFKSCSFMPGGVVFQEEKLGVSSPLKLKSHTAWVKMCNKKVVIIFEVVNKDKLLLEDVHILLNTPEASTTYTTKVFETISCPPYWKENTSNTINSDKNSAILALFDLKETKYNVLRKINLCGAISFKFGSNGLLLPFDDINLSSLDTMDENFDVLSNMQEDSNKYALLALLATTERKEICLRHIQMNDEGKQKLNLMDEFCKNLGMEKVIGISNVLVHKSSPYHILHGIMVIQEEECIGEDKWILSVYTRSQHQILAFIHKMYDAIPYRIVATTTNQHIKSKSSQLCSYDESSSVPSKYFDHSEFQSSMIKQTSMTLEYLDECMIKMNDNKNPVVLSKIGSEIDIFAGGHLRFQEFSSKIREEATKGVDYISSSDRDFEGMVVDLD